MFHAYLSVCMCSYEMCIICRESISLHSPCSGFSRHTFCFKHVCRSFLPLAFGFPFLSVPHSQVSLHVGPPGHPASASLLSGSHQGSHTGSPLGLEADSFPHHLLVGNSAGPTSPPASTSPWDFLSWGYHRVVF